MKKIIASVVMFLCLSACMMVTSVFAQEGGSASSPVTTVIQNDDFYTAPIVPIEVVVKGRQAVTSYLLSQIDHVTVEYSGRSILGQNQSYLGIDYLKSQGYTHMGSFSELSDALARDKFRHAVVKTPNGYYDVSVSVKAHSADGRICLSGHGYLSIEEGKGGLLTAGEFEPYMGIPRTVIIKGEGMLTDAKWLSPNYNDEDLDYRSSVDDGVVTTSLFIPTRILESGYLVIANLDGKVGGVDLKNKTTITGQEVVALLGRIRSSDVVSLKEPSTWSIDWSANGNASVSFFKSEYGDQIYGRFPIIDFATLVAIKQVILPKVRVFGGTKDQMMLPSKIIIKTIWSEKMGPIPIGQEREIPFSLAAGGFMLDVPAGGYHIEVKFEILDPEQNPDWFGKG